MVVKVDHCACYFVKVKGCPREIQVCASKVTMYQDNLNFWIGSDIAVSFPRAIVESMSFIQSCLCNSNDFYVGCY